jgi:hypothetical protein
MSPEGSIWIGLGGTTKLTANITTTSVDFIKIYWQRVENNSIARNIVLNTTKYSGSSSDVPVPELVITDVDTTDAGLYQMLYKCYHYYRKLHRPMCGCESDWWKVIFSFMCIFCRSLFVLLYFFFWPLRCLQGLHEKFCKAEQHCFGAPGQAETSLKIEDLRFN